MTDASPFDDPESQIQMSTGIERNDSKTGTHPRAPLSQSGLDTSTSNHQAFAHNAALMHALETAAAQPPLSVHRALSRPNNPATAALHQLQTDMNSISNSPYAHPGASRHMDAPTICETPVLSESISYVLPSTQQPLLGSSLRSNLSSSSLASSSLSPNLGSPYLAAMADLTPLPSPLVSSASPWRKTSVSRSRAGSSENLNLQLGRKLSQKGSPSSSSSSSQKKKNFHSLLQGAVETSRASAIPQEERPRTNGKGHSRNRSMSEFHAEQLHNVRPRNVTLGSRDHPGIEAIEPQMQREINLAARRGHQARMSDPSPQVPTPPPSTSSRAESDEIEDEEQRPRYADGTAANYLEISDNVQNKRRKFREIRQLGHGTFSRVMLATSARIPAHPPADIEHTIPAHQLVAVKIIEHGPMGGADEQRIETGLKREVDLLKSISHPSLVRLKACEYQPTRTLLVLTYSPGGDLFELASQHRDLLTAPLVQRVFAELVSAVLSLHARAIVHRDLKLENVLVNLPAAQLAALPDPCTHPHPLVTLTDLGLGRRIPAPPAPPLLETRCGSEDYAAPEILLAQPYDGRETDAWALGVLLYALMEGRLPFDAPPGKPERSRNTYRIARCDWIWCRFGDEEGDWDSGKGGGVEWWEGAREVVEGLLKKVRMGRKPLGVVGEMEWVRGGIRVEGGLRLREEDEEMREGEEMVG